MIRTRTRLILLAGLLITALIPTVSQAFLAEVGVASAPVVPNPLGNANAIAGGYSSAIFDQADGFSFFGSSTTDTFAIFPHFSMMPAVQISTFQYVATFWGIQGVTNLTSAVFDPTTGNAYFGDATSPIAGILKIPLITPGVGLNRSASTSISSVTLGAVQSNLESAVIDPAGGYAYFGTQTSMVVKIRLSDLSEQATLTMPSGFGGLSAAVIDTAGGFAYFASTSAPGSVARDRLSDFTLDGTIQFKNGEGSVGSAVIDTINDNAYFGTHDSPGVVVKVDLVSFSRVSSLVLQGGQNDLTSAMIDPVNNLAYFGTNTQPGIIVPVFLSNLTESINPAPLTLSPGQNNLTSGFIDTVNEYAYFGTYTTPGITVKIDFLAGPPFILIQPNSATGHAGDVATFLTTGYGRGLSYQWYLNGAPIPGATASIYTRTLSASDDESVLTCVVTGTNGNVTSNGAVMTVLPIIRAYPNPWRSDQDGGTPFMTFDGLANNSTVKIFNLAAHWVKTLPMATGQTTWDLTNDQGQKVASGYYFYVVTTRDANQTQTGKIAIIH